MSSTTIRHSNTPKIALVGCGAVAELFYLPAFAENPSLSSQVVLVDINCDRAKAMAYKFGIHRYVQDYHDVLSEVDGAIVALPHHLHYKVTMICSIENLFGLISVFLLCMLLKRFDITGVSFLGSTSLLFFLSLYIS